MNVEQRRSSKRSTPMATVKVSNQFAAPVDQVFRYFADVEHAPAHVSGIRRVEMLTTGPFGLGTRWR
jgi:uncharacterized membrane protein